MITYQIRISHLRYQFPLFCYLLRWSLEMVMEQKVYFVIFSPGAYRTDEQHIEPEHIATIMNSLYN